MSRLSLTASSKEDIRYSRLRTHAGLINPFLVVWEKSHRSAANFTPISIRENKLFLLLYDYMDYNVVDIGKFTQIPPSHCSVSYRNE